MKAAPTLQESLGTLAAVTTTGDLRRIIANSLLALARKEISATDAVAMAKMLDSISSSMQTEVNVAKVRLEMHKTGGAVGKLRDSDNPLGQMLITGA